MTTFINQKNKSRLFAALYNQARPQELNFEADDITPEEATQIIEDSEDDYGYATFKVVRGRELNFSMFSDRLFDAEWYEKEYGPISEVLNSLG